MSAAQPTTMSSRLLSLDAYRGFVMLAMVSGGFAFASTLKAHPEIAQGSPTQQWLWETLAYQFSHVEWTGCSFWDLIQPSFMFMVGVSLPFSFSSRRARGQSVARILWHAVVRAVILIALGVFLSSNATRYTMTNFTFVNVLTQIGLGYIFLYPFLGRRVWVQLLGIAAILGGYWYWFYQFETPAEERDLVVRYLQEVKGLDESEWHKFDGLAAHWNKHLNAAASFDRDFLNRFPRQEPEWHGKRFWVNDGGYQTLNFVPSLATMLLGLVAGQWLIALRPAGWKLRRLLLAGLFCFVISMAADTTIWPISIQGADWTVCPAVKRIWTPTFAVFSAGWTFWMLGAFFAVIEMARIRFWAWPLKVVGMNSIAMYVMAQLIKPWVRRTLHTHLNTVSAYVGYDVWETAFGGPYGEIRLSVAVLFVLWLFCAWMYRRKIFIRI